MGEVWQAEVEIPTWATARWQNYAAHIVASEARGVPSADIVIACTLLKDIERGWHPWRLYPGRWHGYGPPDEADRQAIIDALTSRACDDIPVYKYVGNLRDLRHWKAVGMVKTGGPFTLHIGSGGQTVVGVPFKGE